jgi:hypothetical protein
MTFKPFEGNQNPLPWLQRASETNHDEQEEPTPAAALPQAFPENANDGTASEPPEAEESPTGTPGDADTPLSSGEDPEAKLRVGAQSGIQPTLDSGHADNGATAILATAPQDTSTRFRLSDILREAAAQETLTGNPPAVRRVDVASPVPEITPHVVAASTAAAPRTVGEADYPTLLERPRDGKTEPFLDMMPEAMADDVDQDFKELESLPKARDPLAAAGPAPYIAPPPTRERRFQSQAAGRVPWRVVSALALALALAGFIGAFTGWVLTSEDAAGEVNRRIAAELTEIDRYLATNQEAIATAEPNEDGRIVLPNYPLPVTISVEEAALPADELREVILDDAAALMYSDGVEAYGADSSIFDDFSTPGLVRFGIQMTQESTHEALLVLTVLAAVATLAAAAALFFTASDARLLFFGGAVALGGGIALVGSLIMRLVFDRAASREGDNLASGLGDIAEDVSFLFTRNSLVFLAVGLVILTGGFILARLDRHAETTETQREPANIA